MRHVAFYHKDTGVLHRQTTLASDDKAVALNTPADHLPIDHPVGGPPLDWQSQRVNLERLREEHAAHLETHKEAPKPPVFQPSQAVLEDWQPPAPSIDHEWDPAIRRWVLSATAQAAVQAARANATRRAEIIAEQQPLLRQLALDPADAEARKALAALHAEAATLS